VVLTACWTCSWMLRAYAVTASTGKGVAIEIKENRAASTGFDIHFNITRAGVPYLQPCRDHTLWFAKPFR